jgi:hypothetical protein
MYIDEKAVERHECEWDVVNEKKNEKQNDREQF